MARAAARASDSWATVLPQPASANTAKRWRAKAISTTQRWSSKSAAVSSSETRGASARRPTAARSSAAQVMRGRAVRAYRGNGSSMSKRGSAALMRTKAS